MTPQSFIHWLEQGRGTRWVGRLTLILGLVLLSVTVAHKQFQGPQSEETLRQAVLGRQIGTGQGFTTLVNYPQSVARLEARGLSFSPERPLPDVYHPPGYAIVIAALVAGLPESARAGVLGARVVPPDGWRPDYLLLGLNVFLFWLAAFQTWRLGRRLFDERTGVLAAVAVLLAVPLWRHVAAVDGTALAMVLALALFQLLARAEAAPRGRAWGWLGVGSGCLVALFLTDYAWAALLPLVVAYVWWRHRAVAAIALVALCFLLVAPWLVRNVSVTGHLLGLAAQDLALVEGDAQAEPVVARTRSTVEPPPLSWSKVSRKLLRTTDDLFRERLWSSGALVFTGLFAVGWLYRFRRDDVTGLRALLTAALVVVTLVQGTTNSGEGERDALSVLAPLIIVFGAGFFWVLLAGSTARAGRWGWAVAVLVAVQAVPLGHDLLEPRRIHFTYPPYHAPFFQELAGELRRRGGPQPGWMADVPAGAAWYSGLRVWAQPAHLRQLYAIQAEQPLVALVLTPTTLDRPYFAELAASVGPATSRFGEWDRIYRGLAREQLPPDFPLRRVHAVAENFFVLWDPLRLPVHGNSVAPTPSSALGPARETMKP